MRIYRVHINGRLYVATVDEDGTDRFRVTLNGDTYQAETLTRDDISRWVVRLGERVVRAQARLTQHDRVDVWLAGVPFTVAVQPLGVTGYSIEKAAEKLASGDIRAPMPGRVTSILVNVGEEVSVDTPLMVIEAMKMQNEIASPISGKVKSILVREGDVVKKDSTLVLIE